MKYILNWKNEYLEMRIAGGPMDKESANREIKKQAVEHLVELDIAKNTEEAEKLYTAAEKATAEEEVTELHVSNETVSILYGGGYEDRYQIVDYTE